MHTIFISVFFLRKSKPHFSLQHFDSIYVLLERGHFLGKKNKQA